MHISDRIIWTNRLPDELSLYVKEDSLWKPKNDPVYWSTLSRVDLEKEPDHWEPDPSIPAEDVKWGEEEPPEFVIPVPKEKMYAQYDEYGTYGIMLTSDGLWNHYPYKPCGLHQGDARSGYVYLKQESGLWKLSETIRMDKLGTAQKQTTSSPLSSDCQCNGTGWIVGDLGMMSLCPCKKTS